MVVVLVVVGENVADVFVDSRQRELSSIINHAGGSVNLTCGPWKGCAC